MSTEEVKEYSRQGNFWLGGYVTNENSIIQSESGYWYRYIGYKSFPFNVTPGTVPNEQNWVNVGTLISSNDNAIEGATFSEGGTLKNKKDFILDEITNKWYFWNGAFPKIVVGNSTPDTSGGIADDAWVSLGVSGSGEVDVSNLIKKSNNLDDLDDKAAALNNLGAAGKTQNLSDLENKSLALGNLGGVGRTNNLSDLGDVATALDNLKGLQKTMFDGIEGFSNLRLRVPKFAGERVFLKYHTKKADSSGFSNNYRGGGMFIAREGTRADDGGFSAKVTGVNWYWERDIPNIADLTVDDFGAVADAVTDDSAAFIKCYEFMNSTFAINMTGDNARRQGFTLNAGKYYIKPIDLSKYGGVDATTTSGYKNSPEFVLRAARSVVTGLHAAVTIISDKSTSPVFLINHRRMTVHGINWNGQQTTKQNTYDASTNPTGDNMLIGATVGVFNNTASNVQPFLKNVANGGQQGSITCVNSSNTGGIVWDLMDTLDFDIVSIFASNNCAPVVRLGWSNQATGVWDHSTACNIKKGNFQTCCAPAIVAPRLTQGIWDDLWFEHGFCPFDANQSQFEMRAISVESHVKKPVLWRARPIASQYSFPTGNDLDFDTAPTDAGWNSYTTNPDGSSVTQWQSDIEQGFTRLDNAYSEFHNPVTVRWHAGSYRGKNPGSANAWVKVGKLTMPTAGNQFKIVIEASNGYNGLKITDGTVNNNNAPGHAKIQVQRLGSGFKSVIEYEGQSGVLDNRINTISSNEVEVWVQISGYIGGYAVHVYGTGNTRHDSSSVDMFLPSGAAQTTVPSGTACPEVSWWGTWGGYRHKQCQTIPVDSKLLSGYVQGGSRWVL